MVEEPRVPTVLHKSRAGFSRLDGKLRITADRTNYDQHMYVTGTANSALGFAYTSSTDCAYGSGQHLDFLQTWGTFQNNIVLRNNRCYDAGVQGLLPQVDMSNMAVVNNLMQIPTEHSWMINFEDYAYENILLANNTFWGARATMHLQMSNPENFVVINNIFGPRGVAGDRNEPGLLMDYNAYDYYAPATGAEPATHSLWTNPSKIQPSIGLFENVSAEYDAESGYWEYSAPGGDFSLSSDSDARDAGTSSVRIPYDINWDSRDASPDIGAFEY